jgi:hypothetical protein
MVNVEVHDGDAGRSSELLLAGSQHWRQGDPSILLPSISLLCGTEGGTVGAGVTMCVNMICVGERTAATATVLRIQKPADVISGRCQWNSEATQLR